MKLGGRRFMTVRHSMPGRLRVKVPAVRKAREAAKALENWLQDKHIVREVEARAVSGSIVLLFDPEEAGMEALLDLVAEGLEEHFGEELARTALSDPAGEGTEVAGAHCPAKGGSGFLRRFVEVAGLTLFTGYALLRETVWNAPLAQTPASVTGIVATAGAVPLVQRSVQEWRSGEHSTLTPFLAGACVLAVGLGEALVALEIVWIFRLGMLLEDYVAERSRKAIGDVLKVSVRETRLLREGKEVSVPVGKVRAGDTVVVRTGERLPVDGMIVEGEGLVDEAHITGRADPELRRADDKVFAGTVLCQGLIFLRAEKVGEETYLSRIAAMVEDSLARRAPVEKQADVLAARLFWMGLAATAGVYVFTGEPLRAFTAMLVMACPCATVLAASTAVAAALANAARNGLFVKGGLYLETAGRTDCFCFDKTGTLTAGTPRVERILPLAAGVDENRVLALASAAELHNPHPLARAVVEAARERGIEPESRWVCRFVLGRGVEARLGERVVWVGNAAFLEQKGVDAGSVPGEAGSAGKEPRHTVLYVALDGKVQGKILAANALRPGVEEVLGELRRDGVSSLHMVTGDLAPVAEHLAATLGLDGWEGELLPEAKAHYVEILEKTGHRVVMVGDGVNDALALSRADVGVAMGAGGAEAALEAADVALVDDRLDRLIFLRRLSRQALRVIQQNHWLAVSTNVAGVALATAGWLTPLMGGGLHLVHTLGIVLNSSRMLSWHPEGTSPFSADAAKGRLLSILKQGT